MDVLMTEPMSSISQLSAGARPVVVLDGLDECGYDAMLAQLLGSVLLLDKLLVGARPEPEICNGLKDFS